MKELHTISKIVTEITGVTLEAMMRKTRKREILESRQLVSFVAHNHYRIGCTEVSKFFKQNHSTALNSFQVIGDLLTYDKRIIALVGKVFNDLQIAEQLEANEVLIDPYASAMLSLENAV